MGAVSSYVEVRGLRFHYLDWGGEGPTLVLLHGLASTARIWDLTAPYLASWARVVALDQRGHGLTDKPRDGYGFDDVSKDLEAFLEATDLGKPLLVGHSWGGCVALHYASRRPEAVAGLALVDGGTLDVSRWPMERDEARRRLTPPDLSHMAPAELRARITQRLSSWGVNSQAAVESIVACFYQGPDGRVQPRLPRDLHMKVVEALLDYRPEALYPRVRCPVLLLPARWRGREGSPQRAEAKVGAVERAREALAKCAVVWMEESVHDVPIQRPRELADILRRYVQGGFFPGTQG